MLYYVFQNNWSFECLKDEVIPPEYDETSLDFGLELNTLPKITLISSKKTLPNSIPNHQQFLFFDSKLLKIIKGFEVDYLQEFEIELSYGDELLREPVYKTVNIKKVIDAIDRDKSDLVLDSDGEIDFLNELVLKENFDFAPIFRLDGLEVLTLFREDLAQEIVNQGCTGLEFYPANGFRI